MRERSVRGAADPVRAAAVARGDVGLAFDIRPEQFSEQLELGLTRRAVFCRDAPDRTVALDQPDDAVGADHRLRQVTLLVLDHGELAGAIDERRAGRHRVRDALSESVAGEAAPL